MHHPKLTDNIIWISWGFCKPQEDQSKVRRNCYYQ